MSITLPKLIAIVGPTASGKTDLAIAIAKKFKGEIISADSRQFYRGTEIGSDIIPGRWVKHDGRRVYVAKGIPHHLIAFLPPSKPITAAEFKAKAVRMIHGIVKRDKVPILAGGTGLFVSAVVDNFEIPRVPPNPTFRRKLERRTTDALFAELKAKDPVYAGRITPQNRRYIIRALEVMAATGKPFSAQQTKGEPLFDVLQIGIRRPRKELYERIDRRVDNLMKRGLLEEARRLGKRYDGDLPSMSGLGHRQLGMYLAGEVPLDVAIALIKRDTRHFAKRQLTWFGRDGRIRWVKTPSQAVRLSAAFLKKKKSAREQKTA